MKQANCVNLSMLVKGEAEKIIVESILYKTI